MVSYQKFDPCGCLPPLRKSWGSPAPFFHPCDLVLLYHKLDEKPYLHPCGGFSRYREPPNRWLGYCYKWLVSRMIWKTTMYAMHIECRSGHFMTFLHIDSDVHLCTYGQIAGVQPFLRTAIAHLLSWSLSHNPGQKTGWLGLGCNAASAGTKSVCRGAYDMMVDKAGVVDDGLIF